MSTTTRWAAARSATYPDQALQDVPEDWRERYFEPGPGGWTVRPEVRRAVIFGRHDLVVDAPIPRVDLLACRNTLMYFNGEAQKRLLTRLHFALRDDGYLFLGRVEMLLSHKDLFEPVDFKRRVFRKVPNDDLRTRLLTMAATDQPARATDPLSAIAFDRSATAQLVVDPRGFLVMANLRARSLFGLTPADVGRPFHDLELSYRPAELRSHIATVIRQLQPVTVADVRWQPSAEQPETHLEVELVPVVGGGNGLHGVLISFADVTAARELQVELEHINSQLEAAYEELQSSSEELETTNEELQSTNEELETTNEELQSSNEELETINEELQSSNDELQTMNTQLHMANEQVEEINAFLESILGSIRAALVVVDADLRIREWNPRAENLWGLRFSEVRGLPLAELDIGLDVTELVRPAEECLRGGAAEEAVLPAVNRAGRRILCEVTVSPLGGRHKRIDGAILLMRELDGEGGDGGAR
ncbi:MAG TPA: CheR family methyltransferase [Egibacteraceae bacterium]|nr:CheR family methyltransferase [Egibacteraceae bacterium]